METFPAVGYVTSLETKFAAPDTGVLAVIRGYATKYYVLHTHQGRVEVFRAGCFDESLLTNPDVRFWINHQGSREVGGMRDGLELLSDRDGLSFRYPVPDTALGREAMDMISRGGGIAGMSVGYRCVQEAWHDIDGHRVRVLVKCNLVEISIVGTGAVPGSHVIAEQPPFMDSKAAYDTAAMNFRWAVHDVQKAFR